MENQYKPRESQESALSLHSCMLKKGAVLKVDVTYMAKYDEPAIERKVITVQRFGSQQVTQKRRGEVAVNYRLRVSIFTGKGK